MNLCQPGGGASCGACCGLYNFREHGREAVTARLLLHTRVVEALPRTAEAFSAAARELKAHDEAPLFPPVRICPLLGFLDGERQSQVGCLAHPSRPENRGVDLRDCGVYSANVCETFLCPSYTWLTPAEAGLVAAAAPDFYLYGVVITDVDFVKALLALVTRELGEQVDAQRLAAQAVPAVAEAFRLKEDPRLRGSGIFGRFAPDADGEPSLRTLDYAGMGARPAPEDDLLLCVGFAPTSNGELEAGRALVRQRVAAITLAVSP